mmetsp:Transcript_532/g.947  ORF Transcript_532/g.947 Transcript_532/m.947 type:complete len:246 (-) Transcript_532:75-812(-)
MEPLGFVFALPTTTASFHADQATSALNTRACSNHKNPKMFRTRLVVMQQQQQQHQQQMTEEVDPGIVEGTNLRIVKYPSPILRAHNEAVTEFDQELADLAKQMLKVMYASNGVGLAAPQVGINKRIMVFNPKGDPKAWVQEVALINPVIVDKSAKLELGGEGCLSFPQMGGDVNRHVWVKIEAQNTKGKKIKVKYTGWEAIIFQHEYDHLDGILYIDRMSEEERAKVQPRLDELVAEFKDGQPAL